MPTDTLKAGLDYVAAQLKFQSILACHQTQQVTRVVCSAPSFNFSSAFVSAKSWLSESAETQADRFVLQKR